MPSPKRGGIFFVPSHHNFGLTIEEYSALRAFAPFQLSTECSGKGENPLLQRRKHGAQWLIRKAVKKDK